MKNEREREGERERLGRALGPRKAVGVTPGGQELNDDGIPPPHYLRRQEPQNPNALRLDLVDMLAMLEKAGKGQPHLLRYLMQGHNAHIPGQLLKLFLERLEAAAAPTGKSVALGPAQPAITDSHIGMLCYILLNYCMGLVQQHMSGAAVDVEDGLGLFVQLLSHSREAVRVSAAAMFKAFLGAASGGADGGAPGERAQQCARARLCQLLLPVLLKCYRASVYGQSDGHNAVPLFCVMYHALVFFCSIGTSDAGAAQGLLKNTLESLFVTPTGVVVWEVNPPSPFAPPSSPGKY